MDQPNAIVNTEHPPIPEEHEASKLPDPDSESGTDNELWGKGKSASRLAKNHKARLALIEAVATNYALLYDKKTTNKDAWMKIVSDLRMAGTKIATGPLGATKAKAQWGAMTTKFKNYQDNANTTGASSIPVPEHYEQLFNLLGNTAFDAKIHNINFYFCIHIHIYIFIKFYSIHS